MTDNLLELAIATTGGRELWKTLRGLRIDISIGGPIWAMKGWPPEKTFDQILTLDTVKEHIVFTPFTRPDQQMVFDAATDSVTMETLDGQPVDKLEPARAGFKGLLRNSAWDAPHLGYFLGYACWNYFTTPFLFTYPGWQRARSNPGTRPAKPGDASKCGSRRQSPPTTRTRCSTSIPKACNGAWTTSSRSTAAPWSATTPAATRTSAGCR